jgi:hypothetical protein
MFFLPGCRVTAADRGDAREISSASLGALQGAALFPRID